MPGRVIEQLVDACDSFEPSADDGDVDGPTLEFSSAWLQLHFDDDADARLALDEQYAKIRAVLGGNHVGEICRLDPNLGILGQLDAQRFD
ncbi:MAG: hypothetical protein SFV15_25675 [Polyangiaceae bacterium]|nr:hypothetical protein [Polyangiaceae bacterium]